MGSFYKIILPSAMVDHRLRIPEDFSKKYGDELSTSVKFTVRSGQVCHVGVEKADEMLWFTDGWKEFSESHSIGCGFFVVFNYEGDSKFKVLIFDFTATEIYNPRKSLRISNVPNKGKQRPVSSKGEMGSNVSVAELSCPASRPALVSMENGILDRCQDKRRTGKRCCQSLIEDMYEFAPEFAIRINNCGTCISSLESLTCDFHYFTRNKRYKIEDRGKNVKASGMSNSQRPSVHTTEEEKRNVMKKVDNLPATVPFGRQGCVPNGGRIKRHINTQDKESQDKNLDSVFVQEATRKSKRIRYRLNEIKYMKITNVLNPSNAANHWRTDSNEQQLKVKCEEEEELLGGNDSSNDSMMRPVTSTTQERVKAISASLMFKPNNPFFTKVMLQYNVQRSFILNLPSIFAKKYLHGVSDSIQLETSGGKKWTVHCIHANCYVQCLSRGWGRFVKDNNLREGDVCVFELILVKDVVLKVSIFRVGEDIRQTNLPT